MSGGCATGWTKPGPTAVLEHGANPGLISHFTKQALLDIGKRALADKKVAGAAADEIAAVDRRAANSISWR